MSKQRTTKQQVVTDYMGRRLSLLARIARKTEGTRYVTRKSVAAVIRGEITHTRPARNHTQARTGWPSKATSTRVKIGCHVFTGENARRIIEWATT
jgi:hypothetical protein